jgi:hypothetical protein
MDGKGAWRNNVFVERIWKSVKYEEVYLHAYDSVGDARASIGRYLDFYNTRRPHSSLDRRTPDEAYFDHLRRVRRHELRHAFGAQLRSGYALLASHPKSASPRQRKPGGIPLIERAELFTQTEPALPAGTEIVAHLPNSRAKFH